MAQSDSQDSESEVPDPLDFDNPPASEDDGGISMPESIDGLKEGNAGSEEDFFEDEVQEMLASIEIDDDADDESGTDPIEEEEDDASLMEEIRDQIANAFSDDLDEEADEEIEEMPDPRLLMSEAAGDPAGKEEPKAEATEPKEGDEKILSDIQESVADAFGEEEAEELMSMPDPQSLMSEASGEESVEALASEAEGDELAEELVAPLPSPDELLAEAGKLLNGDEDSSSEYEEGEEIMSMPDPQSLMSEASGDKSASVESEGVEVLDTEEGVGLVEVTADSEPVTSEIGPEEAPVAGNIADRAGDLPPPPPAPVALDESELTEEEDAVEEVEEFVPNPLSSETDFASSLDSLEEDHQENDDLESLVPEEVELTESLADVSSEVSNAIESEGAGDSDDDATEGAESVVAVPSVPAVAQEASAPVNRLWYMLPVAASIMFVGLGLILVGLKEELYEYFESGNWEGSSLTRAVAAVSQRVIEDLGPENHYEMRWMESDVEKVSETEIRIHARVGAELSMDLYEEVLEVQALADLAFDENDLSQAKTWLAEYMPKADLERPRHPWGAFCRLAASKGDVFSVSVTYRLVRPSAKEDWALANIRVNSDESRSAWGVGSPIDAFGPRAIDVESDRFSSALHSYEEEGLAYLAEVTAMQSELAAKKARTLQELQKRREQLALALSEGAYFTGIAIVGEDGDESREVSLVITESRNEGDIIQGVFRLGSEEMPEKHFTGIVDFEEKEEGSLQGLLSLTTVAFSGQPDSELLPLFFRPSTVSRIILRTDGSQMEGDASSVSLRLARSL